jgi:class 3 adenylate cyclase
MKSTNRPYDVNASAERISQILDESDNLYLESNTIPDSSRLSYTNGFNVQCASLFIDIRGSSQLPAIHTRPVLAKLYRAYVSECIAVLNGLQNCAEIFIQGDCVSAVFDTTDSTDIDRIFETAAKLNSLVQVLNFKLERKGYSTIQCGIGLASGQALMVKAGYNGSGINETVWMGNVVNEAAHLCHKGSRGDRAPVQVSNEVYMSLRPDYRAMLYPVHRGLLTIENYEAYIVNALMEEWIQQEKFKVRQKNAIIEALLGSPTPPESTAATRLYPDSALNKKKWL